MTNRDDEARQLWCMRHRIGQLFATFMAGEEMRCPADKPQSGGVTTKCGHVLPVGRPNPLTKVVVRVKNIRAKPVFSAGFEKECPNCGSSLEILPHLEATG
jgi:hypothetical protein